MTRSGGGGATGTRAGLPRNWLSELLHEVGPRVRMWLTLVVLRVVMNAVWFSIE